MKQARHGEAAKSPRQILADAAIALRHVRSFTVQGSFTLSQRQVRIDLQVHDPSSLRMAIASYGASAEMILDAGSAFVRGNTGFWTNEMGARGSLLADRWIQVPPRAATSIVGTVRNLSSASMARCLTRHHGTLTVLGAPSVEGRPAVLVKDAGDVPGSTPEVIAFATRGPAYPLQLTTTGPRRPGGRIDSCNDDSGGVVGSVTFAGFGTVGPIAPPARSTRAGVGFNT